ncbi:Transcriptional regulator2C AraC family (plasmid) [Leptolyngbya boryana IAM M-101]|nr:Transcriptional regulator2C AraC family [Leptolyngbya boryana IAM M-101]BAS66406.1 Transcriptional regulator2C AraC family [Leptolyngbya boryana dg5]
MREGNDLSVVQTRLLPMGTMELVINLNEDSIPLFDRQSRRQQGSTNGIMLCGTHSENFIIRDAHQISIMGVHFKVGGGAAFFELPAGELYNERISLNEIWKTQASELRECLLQHFSPEHRFYILEQFLMQMMRLPDHHPAVDFALQQFQQSANSTINAVIEQTGFSPRYFNQLFRNQVGVTPKLFCRIQRFQNALKILSVKAPVDWMEIALTCGYFDQAHFIHDFRAFADCTPTEYLTQRGFHPCHVVLPN